MVPAKFWIFSTLFAVGVIVGLSYLLIFPITDDSRTVELPAEPPHALSPIKSTNQLAASNLPAVMLSHRSETENPQPVDAQSLLGSATLNYGSKPAGNSTNSESSAVKNYDINTLAANQLLEEGDLFLMAGNFAAAATRYQKSQKISGRVTSELSIRLGICAELDEQPGAAAKHFQLALESKAPRHHRLLALSGLSRTWIERGNRHEALHILCELFLESLGTELMPEELQAQIGYQLGRAIQDIAFRNYHYDLNLPDGVSFQTSRPDPSIMVDLLKSSPASNSTAVAEPNALRGRADGDPNPKITVLQRPNELIDLMIVDVQSTLQPVALLTKHLASANKLELFASDEAKMIINGRSKSLRVKDVQASLLLDHLLIPLDLFWFQDAEGIHLFSMAEKSVQPHLDNFWRDAMERMYRRFNVAFPGDYRHHSALLARGNLKFIDGNLDQAANHYQELANLNPKEEILARLFFNIGKIEMRLGRNLDAIRHFYHAVDQSYDTEFQSTGYCLVGQLSLETNQLDQSIKAAGRGLALAHTDQQQRLAALTMARAYLLSSQPFSANQVLFDNRGVFTGTRLESTAAVLGCYARYIGVTDKISLQSESNRLLASIAMAPDHNNQNFLDIYIAGRAFQELGFQEKAIEKLTLAAESTTIPDWRRRFLFELGVQLNISGKREKAAAVFEFLIQGETDHWRDKSLLQLAQIYLALDRQQDCIGTCEQLWNRSLNEADKKITLDAMGRAYRELGEHHSAAICFAGMLPPQWVNQSTNLDNLEN